MDDYPTACRSYCRGSHRHSLLSTKALIEGMSIQHVRNTRYRWPANYGGRIGASCLDQPSIPSPITIAFHPKAFPPKVLYSLRLSFRSLSSQSPTISLTSVSPGRNLLARDKGRIKSLKHFGRTQCLANPVLWYSWSYGGAGFVLS